MIKLAMCVPQLQKRSINTKTLAIDQTAGSRTSVFYGLSLQKNEIHVFRSFLSLQKNEIHVFRDS